MGRPARGQTALRRHSIAARSRRSASRSRPRPSCEPDQVKLRPSALSPADRDGAGRRSSAPSTAASTTAPGCCARAASPRWTCCAARTPASRTRPTRCCCPATRTRSPRSCGTAREHSIAVVPFGGGTSVVGGLDPIRGEFKAVISLDLRRLNELHSLDEVSGEAELGAGRHRTRRRTTARRARLLARPLPAELPVRDHRRVRRDAVVGPGLGGLRPFQRHGPRSAHGHACGRARPRPRAGVGGGPGPATTDDRLGGRVRGHHPRARSGTPGAGGHPLRGVVVPRLRDRRRRAARRRADRHRARP